jgi:hypothetical protein
VWLWYGGKGLHIAVHTIANTLPVATSVVVAVNTGTRMVATEVVTKVAALGTVATRARVKAAPVTTTRARNVSTRLRPKVEAAPVTTSANIMATFIIAEAAAVITGPSVVATKVVAVLGTTAIWTMIELAAIPKGDGIQSTLAAYRNSVLTPGATGA